MARSMTATDRAMDKIIVDGIKTFLATYQQTKLAGDVGGWTWARAEKLMIARAIAKNRRGNSGFQGDISNIGQTP